MSILDRKIKKNFKLLLEVFLMYDILQKGGNQFNYFVDIFPS